MTWQVFTLLVSAGLVLADALREIIVDRLRGK